MYLLGAQYVLLAGNHTVPPHMPPSVMKSKPAGGQISLETAHFLKSNDTLAESLQAPIPTPPPRALPPRRGAPAVTGVPCRPAAPGSRFHCADGHNNHKNDRACGGGDQGGNLADLGSSELGFLTL